MYVIIIISKDPDIVGTTPIYVHYKRWMTLGSWTFFLHSVVWAPNKLRPLFCTTTSCTTLWIYQVLAKNISACVYICVLEYLCVYVYEFLFLAHICMSGGISVSNVLRFWVEVLFCVLWFDDKSLNWFVPLLSRQRRVSNPWIEHKSIW